MNDKIECVTPVPMSEYESMCYNIIHNLNLPTIAETQLSRGGHRQRVKGHGEAQVQQRIGGSMFLAV